MLLFGQRALPQPEQAADKALVGLALLAAAQPFLQRLRGGDPLVTEVIGDLLDIAERHLLLADEIADQTEDKFAGQPERSIERGDDLNLALVEDPACGLLCGMEQGGKVRVFLCHTAELRTI